MIYFVSKYVGIHGGCYKIIIVRVILHGVMSQFSVGTFPAPSHISIYWYQFSYPEGGGTTFI
jgi:hypothetical protein